MSNKIQRDDVLAILKRFKEVRGESYSNNGKEIKNQGMTGSKSKAQLKKKISQHIG